MVQISCHIIIIKYTNFKMIIFFIVLYTIDEQNKILFAYVSKNF
jgi:hypothetical protein